MSEVQRKVFLPPGDDHRSTGHRLSQIIVCHAGLLALRMLEGMLSRSNLHKERIDFRIKLFFRLEPIDKRAGLVIRRFMGLTPMNKS